MKIVNAVSNYVGSTGDGVRARPAIQEWHACGGWRGDDQDDGDHVRAVHQVGNRCCEEGESWLVVTPDAEPSAAADGGA